MTNDEFSVLFCSFNRFFYLPLNILHLSFLSCIQRFADYIIDISIIDMMRHDCATNNYKMSTIT